VYVRACCSWDKTYKGFKSSSLVVATLVNSAAHAWAAVDAVSFLLSCVVSATSLVFVDSITWLCVGIPVMRGCEQVVNVGGGAVGGATTRTPSKGRSRTR